MAAQGLEPVCTNPQCQRKIRLLEEELQRLKSVGYDMLKQRGEWQALGKKPTESSLEFNNLFDHEVEDLAKDLKESSGMKEDTARQVVCQEFQTLYERLKRTIFNQLVKTLHKVFMLSTEEDGEQLYDICRAYGLLLNASGIMKEPVHDQAAKQRAVSLHEQHKSLPSTTVESFTSKSAQLSWDMLTNIPPMLSLTPPSHFFKQWHEKELAPTWNKELTDYELAYYRPVLFMSCEGKVARKGWVGNQETTIGTQACHDKDKPGSFEPTVSEVSDIPASEEDICQHCGYYKIPGMNSVPQDYYKPQEMVWTKHPMRGRAREADGAGASETQQKAEDSNKDEVTTRYYPQRELSLNAAELCVKNSNMSTSNIGIKLT